MQALIQVRENNVGKDTPDVARSLQELAELYHKLGKFELAEQYNAKALAIRENSVGGSHADVAQSLNHLAQLNFSRGNYAKALEIQERCLQLTGNQIGDNGSHMIYLQSRIRIHYLQYF